MPRHLTMADTKMAADLIRRAFAGQPVDPAPSAVRETAETVAAHLAAHGGAGAGDPLVGVLLWEARGDALYVGRLAVAPEQRGRGIATTLLATAETEARRRGLARLLLGVRVELLANHRLFARLGFRETGRTSHPGYDRPTSIDMAKMLA